MTIPNKYDLMSYYIRNLILFVFFRNWQTIMYGISENLYPLIGFFICFIVNVLVSLVFRCVRMCAGKKQTFVEPVLLHPLARRESSLKCCGRGGSMKLSSSRKSCPRHPFSSMHLSGSYGNRQQSDPMWNEDSHYRWPSPSLPPTLKKGTTFHRNHNNNYEGYHMHYNQQHKIGFSNSTKKSSKVQGTLDHGRGFHERPALHASKEHDHAASGGAINANNNGREYYNLTNNEKYRKRGRNLKNKNIELNQNEEILDEFGDVVVVRSRPKQNPSQQRGGPYRSGYSFGTNKAYKARISGLGSSSEDDDDGWTTEF